MIKKTLGTFIFVFTMVMNTWSQDKMIDEVVAVVGNNIVTYSDIETQYAQYRLQGSIQGSSSSVKCQIIENMLFQKVLLNQAEVDSVVISDDQVESELDRKLRYYIAQFGSKEKFEEFYKKSVDDFKNEFRTLMKEQMLIQNMESTITEDAAVTPSEVKKFYSTIPVDSLPVINAEYEIGQIVKQPLITEVEKVVIKEKLNALRERVLKGETFSTLAIMYSEDPGSSKKGGELGLHARGDMYPEFEAVAFNLKKNEVSAVVETKSGFHIIQMIERRGEYVNVRHILFQTKVSVDALSDAKAYLDSVRTLIGKDSMTFEKAALKFSDDPSKNNGGMMVNPSSGTVRFIANEIDPTIFFVVDKLNVGEVSLPVLMRTDDGKQAYRLLYLKARTAPHRANLKDDYDKIRAAALDQKKSKLVNDWIKDKVSKMSIQISDDFKNCPFQHEWINAQ